MSRQSRVRAEVGGYAANSTVATLLLQALTRRHSFASRCLGQFAQVALGRAAALLALMIAFIAVLSSPGVSK